MGTLLFWGLTGGHILNPQDTAWLSQNDPLTSWLGWDFFRHTPLLQWPIGANWNYGMELGSSIVFTDSIPLLAIVFKFFSFALPASFQYFGIWILLCLILQIVWAQKLIGMYCSDSWFIRIASLFFACAPILIWRLHGHYALFGQWVILAALYLYLRKAKSCWAWSTLICTSALIQAYLLAMVLIIWLANAIQIRLTKQEKIGTQFLHGACILASLLTVMWAAGYFMVKSGVSTWGFGFYRMNLLSPFDPDGIWSWLLVDQTNAPGDYEGFSYLGLGILILVPIASYVWLKKKSWRFSLSALVLGCVCIALLAYAISNRIAFGGHELASYNITSQPLQLLVNIFRNSGRFFWPVYYLLYLAVIVCIGANFKRSMALGILLATFCIQLADSSKAWAYFHQKYLAPQTKITVMSSPLWQSLLTPYQSILLVLPKNQAPQWQAISQLAAQFNKTVNVGYFARTDLHNEERVRRELANQVLQNTLSPHALYLFEDNALWQAVLKQKSAADFAGVLNGFRVFAPNFKSEPQFANVFSNILPAQADKAHFAIPLTIQFSDQGSGRRYFAYGWSDSEAAGTWSNGTRATLIIPTPHSLAIPLQLSITTDAFLAPGKPTQEVRILINGQPTKSWIHTEQNNLQTHQFVLPANLLANNDQNLQIEFELIKPTSPAQLGISDDSRQLGIRLKSLVISSSMTSK